MINGIVKRFWILTLGIVISFCPQKTSAWGPEGHTIVVQIAMQFLQPDVKQNVLALLDTMSVNTAANWMDIMRSNSDYDFMKPWHYIDFGRTNNISRQQTRILLIDLLSPLPNYGIREHCAVIK